MLNYVSMNAGFTDFLNKEMEKRSWSQAELARRTGLTTGGVSMLLNQTRNPSPDTLIVLAKVLNYPPEEMFRIAGLLPPEKQEEPTREEINYKLSLLPPEKQQIILDLVDSFIAKNDQEARAALHGKGSPQH